MHSSIKRLVNMIFIGQTNQKVENLANDIANQCRARLTKLVSRESKVLPPEQMRGYIRAYVTDYLESVVKQRIDTNHFHHSQISKIILQAKELVIEMVACDMQCMPHTVVADIATAA